MSDNDSDEELFDPSDKQYATKTSKFKDLKTPGTYLLGCRKMVEVGETPNGKLYSKCAFVVLDGPRKGESFVDRIFRSPSGYKRLALVCKAMRITEKWNPQKNSEAERVLIGRALKASCVLNDHNYIEIKWPEDEWTENELALMTAWEKDFKRQRAKELEDHGDPRDFVDDSGDPGPQPGPDNFGGSDFGDDDIPFE